MYTAFPYRLSSATIPAASADLADLATLKDDCGITTSDDDAFLARAITRCSRAVSRYCNRTFGAATYQDTFRLDRPQWNGVMDMARNPLMLAHHPIFALTTVVLTPPGGQPITLTSGMDYEMEASSGLLYRLHQGTIPGMWSPVQTTVIYGAGYVLPSQNAADFPGAETLPDDIQDAVTRMVSSRYSERQRDPYLKSEETAGVRQEYWIPTKETDFSPDVAAILDMYRVPVVA